MTDLTMVGKPEYDSRTQYFVRMFKDGNYVCDPVPVGREDYDQNTMELDYEVTEPTDEDKIKYALTMPDINGFDGSNKIKNLMAKERVGKSDFSIPNAWNPNVTRVHEDPEYFFKTPARPIIWTLKRGTEEEAIAEAQTYLKNTVDSGKWDLAIAVYKEQYNVVED